MNDYMNWKVEKDHDIVCRGSKNLNSIILDDQNIKLEMYL